MVVKFVKSYYIKKPSLTRTQGLSKNLTLKILCDINFPLLPN